MNAKTRGEQVKFSDPDKCGNKEVNQEKQSVPIPNLELTNSGKYFPCPFQRS
jgi:hypothetical protein